jgi:Fe-S cluster biogenesis protein NfuA
MFIQTEQTPNPATLKFLPGRAIVEQGQVEVLDADEAERVSPLARRLFAVEGVRSVFITRDFVAVTKQVGADWYLLKPAVLGAMVEHFMSGEPAVAQAEAPAAPAVHAPEDDETVTKIKELLDTRVRPAVANDGGDIVFHGFERGVVYLHMKGACAGCPSSIVTLKNGIENLLRYYVPDVVEVRAID